MANNIRERMLRRKEVQARTGLSRSTIYALIHTGQFPAPIALTERTVAWPESSIDQWIEARISQGRSKGGVK